MSIDKVIWGDSNIDIFIHLSLFKIKNLYRRLISYIFSLTILFTFLVNLYIILNMSFIPSDAEQITKALGDIRQVFFIYKLHISCIFVSFCSYRKTCEGRSHADLMRVFNRYPNLTRGIGWEIIMKKVKRWKNLKKMYIKLFRMEHKWCSHFSFCHQKCFYIIVTTQSRFNQLGVLIIQGKHEFMLYELN